MRHVAWRSNGGRRPKTRALDALLAVICIIGACAAVRPLASDLIAGHQAETVISSMTSVVDKTYDRGRMNELKQAQEYNLHLGGAEAGTDNQKLAGGNGGSEDILELADVGDTVDVGSYENQLAVEGGSALCWIEIKEIALREPVYHGTSDETLSMGAGHLQTSSLPVGGVSSHCVICAHSGMRNNRMFDDLERLARGSRFTLHTLGDAYAYEVYDIETVLPEEAGARCAIRPGEDLCTLVTCTPYGINSHRLLVHGMRVPYQPQDEREGGATYQVLNRRTYPLLGLAGGSLATLGILLVTGARRRAAQSAETRSYFRVRQRAMPRRVPFSSPNPVRQGCFRTSSAFTQRRRDGVSPVWVAGALALMLAGGALFAAHGTETSAYQALAHEVMEPSAIPASTEGEASAAEIDWAYLRSKNPDVVAWVRVEGTTIDLPVMAPSDGDMAYYLTHDFWNNPSMEGVPFLDHRSSATGIHRLAFGHHLTLGGQFSELQHAWEQDAFDSLGGCDWITPERGTTELQPYCALKTDQWTQSIQRFAFTDGGDMQAWLRKLDATATAHSAATASLTQSAKSVVTLVTCASDISGQPWRTAVIFVEP